MAATHSAISPQTPVFKPKAVLREFVGERKQQLLPMLMAGGMPTLPGFVFRLNHAVAKFPSKTAERRAFSTALCSPVSSMVWIGS